MVYGYYARLSAREKAVYRQSDRFHRVTLSTTAGLAPLLAALDAALARASRHRVQKTSQRVCDRLAAIWWPSKLSCALWCTNCATIWTTKFCIWKIHSTPKDSSNASRTCTASCGIWFEER